MQFRVGSLMSSSAGPTPGHSDGASNEKAAGLEDGSPGKRRVAQPSPLAGALSISASVFVAFTSLFVAAIAFVAGAHQLDPTGLSGEQRAPSESARTLSHLVGVLALLNGFVAGARGRKSVPVAIVTSCAFVVLATSAGWLFAQTW